MTKLDVGMAAPNFAMKGHDGKLHTLKDLAGKPVVMVFYCMNDTPG